MNPESEPSEFHPNLSGSLDVSLTATIRHMAAADLPALEWDGAFTHFRRQFAKAFRDYRSGRGIPWVAVRRADGAMLGQVFVLLESRYRSELADGRLRAYLYSIRIKPAFRGGGLGTRMMDVAEDDLFNRGYSVATLNVARDNSDGYRFYTRRGYRVAAPEPGQWSFIDHRGRRRFVDEPAWRMEKTLR